MECSRLKFDLALGVVYEFYKLSKLFGQIRCLSFHFGIDMYYCGFLRRREEKVLLEDSISSPKIYRMIFEIKKF